MAARHALTVLLAPALALAMAGLPTGPAGASEPPASLEVANPNAALRYFAAWRLLTPEMLGKPADVDWTPIAKELDPAKMPKEYREAVETEYDSGLEVLLWATQTERCDFELHYDAGWKMYLPHLGQMRASTRLLRLDARKQLLAGDADKAVERIVAIERMANHLIGDRTLISSLVGLAIAPVGFEEIEALLASGRMTEAGRDSLLASLQALDTKDPMGVRAGLAFETVTTTNWVRRTYRGPSAGRDLAECIGHISEGEAAHLHAAALGVLDEAGLDTELERYGALSAEVLGAWDGPEPTARLAEIEERVAAGAFGHLGVVLAPAPSKCRAAADKFRAALRTTIQKVTAAGVAGAAPGAAPASKKGAGG